MMAKYRGDKIEVSGEQARRFWHALARRLMMAGLVAIVGTLLMSSCERFQRAPKLPDDELVVLTLESPGHYYRDSENATTGFEAQLAERFAARLGVKLRVVVAPDATQLLKRLERGHAHLAAAGIELTDTLAARFRAGPVVRRTPIIAVAANAAAPRSPGAVGEGPVGVIKESAVEAALNDCVVQGIARKSGTPAATCKGALGTLAAGLPLSGVVHAESVDALLGALTQGRIKLALLAQDAFEARQNQIPGLTRAFDLRRDAGQAWLLPKPLPAEATLAARVAAELEPFFEELSRRGVLASLEDRHFRAPKPLPPVDLDTFLARAQSVLPRFRTHFHAGERITGIDWRLLAAVGYQESQWNPLATSPTGVRGLMMLTEETADRLGVRDRLDAAQSIFAGSRYLAQLKDAIPERITEPDRTWLALAAYNQGPGHLEDARVLTQRLKRNPDAWADVRTTFPLLRDETHFATLRNGFARGDEAVAFVDRVHSYYDLLRRVQPALDDAATTATTDPDTPRAARLSPPLPRASEMALQDR